MSKSRIVAAATLAGALALGGCGSNPSSEDIGTVGGAAVGGVVGSEVTGGSTLGTVGGAIGGGVLGRELGQEYEERKNR